MGSRPARIEVAFLNRTPSYTCPTTSSRDTLGQPTRVAAQPFASMPAYDSPWAIVHEWNWGDGSSSRGTPSEPLSATMHLYAAAGQYTTILTTTWLEQYNGSYRVINIITATAPIEVLPNLTMQAVTSAPDTLGQASTLDVRISQSQPVSDEPRPYTMTVEWGDGVRETYTGAVGIGLVEHTLMHTYATAADFNLVVEVTDDNGALTRRSLFVRINPPPNAVFSFTIVRDTMRREGVVVQFTSHVLQGAGPLIYAWDFGDGGTSSAADPEHMYADYGKYKVSLQVTDGSGVSCTYTAIVELSPWTMPEDPPSDS